ncbi:MAG: glycosyltransferase [Calditrichaeota bacterium]|nr:MAG: glycosyltransferase [Calditrichota bacterium]MBL1205921.1 glycosyltransferase [Calditrichota bacterium]NOG45749.1 glycosyltransferase family 2 protein [Calditrichota bacterium]
MPQVSIILPFFNAEKTLLRAISSIADQTLRDIEIIMVDNNSTDKSRTISESQVTKDPRFILISEKKQGVVFASNAGSAIASGKYICRMDADDWSHPDRLERQVQFLEENPDFGVVAGLVEYVGHHENTQGFSRYVDLINSIQTYSQISNRRFIESPIVNPSAMWRKEVADNLGMYRDGKFPEDYELWLRWLGAGIKMHKIPRPVLKWHDSDGRLTRTDRRYSDKAFYEIKTKYLADWLKDNNPHHPNVAVWGASRISRLRARILEKHGVHISCYIDITGKRKLDREVINYKEIPSPKEMFILTYIRQANARIEIQEFLESRGYTEGENYLLIS